MALGNQWVGQEGTLLILLHYIIMKLRRHRNITQCQGSATMSRHCHDVSKSGRGWLACFKTFSKFVTVLRCGWPGVLPPTDPGSTELTPVFLPVGCSVSHLGRVMTN